MAQLLALMIYLTRQHEMVLTVFFIQTQTRTKRAVGLRSVQSSSVEPREKEESQQDRPRIFRVVFLGPPLRSVQRIFFNAAV